MPNVISNCIDSVLILCYNRRLTSNKDDIDDCHRVENYMCGGGGMPHRNRNEKQVTTTVTNQGPECTTIKAVAGGGAAAASSSSPSAADRKDVSFSIPYRDMIGQTFKREIKLQDSDQSTYSAAISQMKVMYTPYMELIKQYDLLSRIPVLACQEVNQIREAFRLNKDVSIPDFIENCLFKYFIVLFLEHHVYALEVMGFSEIKVVLFGRDHGSYEGNLKPFSTMYHAREVSNKQCMYVSAKAENEARLSFLVDLGSLAGSLAKFKFLSDEQRCCYQGKELNVESEAELRLMHQQIYDQSKSERSWLFHTINEAIDNISKIDPVGVFSLYSENMKHHIKKLCDDVVETFNHRTSTEHDFSTTQQQGIGFCLVPSYTECLCIQMSKMQSHIPLQIFPDDKNWPEKIFVLRPSEYTSPDMFIQVSLDANDKRLSYQNMIAPGVDRKLWIDPRTLPYPSVIKELETMYEKYIGIVKAYNLLSRQLIPDRDVSKIRTYLQCDTHLSARDISEKCLRKYFMVFFLMTHFAQLEKSYHIHDVTWFGRDLKGYQNDPKPFLHLFELRSVSRAHCIYVKATKKDGSETLSFVIDLASWAGSLAKFKFLSDEQAHHLQDKKLDGEMKSFVNSIEQTINDLLKIGSEKYVVPDFKNIEDTVAQFKHTDHDARAIFIDLLKNRLRAKTQDHNLMIDEAKCFSPYLRNMKAHIEASLRDIAAVFNRSLLNKEHDFSTTTQNGLGYCFIPSQTRCLCIQMSRFGGSHIPLQIQMIFNRRGSLARTYLLSPSEYAAPDRFISPFHGAKMRARWKNMDLATSLDPADTPRDVDSECAVTIPRNPSDEDFLNHRQKKLDAQLGQQNFSTWVFNRYFTPLSPDEHAEMGFDRDKLRPHDIATVITVIKGYPFYQAPLHYILSSFPSTWFAFNEFDCGGFFIDRDLSSDENLKSLLVPPPELSEGQSNTWNEIRLKFGGVDDLCISYLMGEGFWETDVGQLMGASLETCYGDFLNTLRQEINELKRNRPRNPLDMYCDESDQYTESFVNSWISERSNGMLEYKFFDKARGPLDEEESDDDGNDDGYLDEELALRPVNPEDRTREGRPTYHRLYSFFQTNDSSQVAGGGASSVLGLEDNPGTGLN